MVDVIPQLIKKSKFDISNNNSHIKKCATHCECVIPVEKRGCLRTACSTGDNNLDYFIINHYSKAYADELIMTLYLYQSDSYATASIYVAESIFYGRLEYILHKACVVALRCSA